MFFTANGTRADWPSRLWDKSATLPFSLGSTDFRQWFMPYRNANLSDKKKLSYCYPQYHPWYRPALLSWQILFQHYFFNTIWHVIIRFTLFKQHSNFIFIRRNFFTYRSLLCTVYYEILKRSNRNKQGVFSFLLILLS